MNEVKSLFQQVGINFETYSLTSYTQLVLSSNYLTADIETEDRLVYFNYEKGVSRNKFAYRAYTFKGTDAFWLCQFGVIAKNYDALSSDIVKYAKSIAIY